MASFIPSKPQLLSLDIDGTARIDNLYCLLIGGIIKYLHVNPGIFNSDTLAFFPDLYGRLPELSSGDWTRARIVQKSGHLAVEVLYGPLRGLKTR